MDAEELRKLPVDTLVSIILAQGARIAGLTALVESQAATIAQLEKRVAELEDQLGKPPKTPDNSSLPPSLGQKPNLPERERKGRKGRPGVNRQLAENPDRVIEALARECPKCAAALSEADQPRVHAYDHVDMPPIRPVTTRVHLHSGVCPCCAVAFTAPAPVGMEPGSPFGPGIQALVIHLHVTQAISFAPSATG